MTDKRLVVLVGATGSGKTDLSIRLAKHYRAPILSLLVRNLRNTSQMYRGMPIGTAQPTNEQLKAIEHHFIATLDIQQDFNCGQYEVQALELLRQLFVRHDTVIAVGGSGLYVKALWTTCRKPTRNCGEHSDSDLRMKASNRWAKS